MADMIELKIRQNAGLIAEEMMVGGPDEILASDEDKIEISPGAIGAKTE